MAITKDRKITIDQDLIIGHVYEVAVRAIAENGETEAVDLAPKGTILLQGVIRAPTAPTDLVAAPFLYTIFLTWVNPLDADFDVTEVWRSNSDDIAAAAKIGEVRTTTFTDNVGATGLTRYYWVRARNTSGIVGEYNATAGTVATTGGIVATDIADFAVTATKMFTNTIVLSGEAWTNHSPSACYIAWNAHTIVYNGVSYPISSGATASRYVAWAVGATAYSTSSTHPVLGATNFMIATNESGVVQPVWNSSANMVIGSAFILDAAITTAKIGSLAVDTGNIGNLAVTEAKIASLAVTNAKIGLLAVDTAQIAALAVTDAKIASLAVNKLTAGTISSKAITLAVAAGTGDVYVAAGKTDFTNTDAGFILGVDDSDSDKAKFYIGDSTKFLNWTGTALTVQGLIQTAASGQRMVLDNSDNTLRFYNASDANIITMNITSSIPSIDMVDATNGAQIKVTKDSSDAALLANWVCRVTSSLSGPCIDAISSNSTHNTGIVKASVTGSGGGYLFYGEDAADNRVFGVTSGGRCYVGEKLEVTGAVDTADKFTVDGVKVVGNQGSAVADATGAGDVVAQLNTLLSRLRAHGLIAT